MQREELNPDIQTKFQHLIAHMNQKNGIVSEFLNILKEICDTEIFYSRTMDKFANNISKLMIGKDPLKQVFIIFERLIGAKSEQSMIMANSIKDDMIPFIEKEALDLKQQNQLRQKQKIVKQMKINMQRKLRLLHSSENGYKRAYQILKRYTNVQTRSQLQQKQKSQKLFNDRENSLVQSINSYNHTVQQYYLNYTSICQKLSDIQTHRKQVVKDAINKFMIFQISCIKNIEYNIPRYMDSLGKMNQRLVIQDRMSLNESSEGLTSLAKISINNYIASLSNRDKIDIPNSHKRILQIKKNTENTITRQKYHQLSSQLYKILDQASKTNDVRVLKEIVYFSRNVYTIVTIEDKNMNLQQLFKNGRAVFLLLLDSVMCHSIFQLNQFWAKYEQKLFDIIQKESRLSVSDVQNKQVQISLNFLAADLQFLRIVSYHQLPNNILSKFTIISPINDTDTSQSSIKSIPTIFDKQFTKFIETDQNIK